jgi:hypothetical protein
MGKEIDDGRRSGKKTALEVLFSGEEGVRGRGSSGGRHTRRVKTRRSRGMFTSCGELPRPAMARRWDPPGGSACRSEERVWGLDWWEAVVGALGSVL